MKKNLFLAALALVALASCTDSDFVGYTSPDVGQNEQGAIVFNSGAQTVTRANHVGADAANLLSNHFTVGGFKGNGTARTTVFDNYIVNWTTNTAGTTTSNTSDWEYVGLDIAKPSSIYQESQSEANKQTIKYWDYSAAQYDFVAYSTGAKAATTETPTSGTNVKVTAIDPANLTTAAYTIQGASRADLAGCYIADMVTVYKADDPATYGKEVTLTFRSLASKVRMALYETIPGYSVKEVNFYTTDPTTLGTSSTSTAALIGTMNETGTYTVKFPTIGSTNKSDADYNKAHVTFASGGTTSAYQTFGSLDAQYTTKERYEKTGTKFLGRTSTTATFAGTSTFYQPVLPNETGTVFELAIDYTLESIDGSGEEIKVYGATAYIPAQFTKWLPNYAYTYIFKISDNTNGWTNNLNTDPKGLYPITFDAVVVDSEYNTQSTITTVASPSITTYQKGHVYTAGPEYSASTTAGTDSIYIQVMNSSTLASDLASKGKLYTVTGGPSGATVTEAEVMDALNIQVSESGGTITGRNTWVLTPATVQHSDGSGETPTFGWIPGADGNPISVTTGVASRFYPSAGTYAYVYDTGTWDGIEVKYTTQPTGWPTGWYTDKACRTAASTFTASTTYYMREGYIYTAETMTSSAPEDWTTANLWWKDPNGTTAVGTWSSDNNGKVFYKRYTANAKIYGVKVIKVQ